MKTTKGHLSLVERQTIHLMRAEGKSFAEIGRAIGRDRSVVWREVKRNQSQRHIWSRLTPLEKAKEAHERAQRRRSDSKRGRRGPLKLAAVRKEIANLLQECRYSPEDIADVLHQGDLGVSVCGRTIRRWLLKDAPELRQYLPERGRKRRSKLTPRKKRGKTAAPEKRSIHERPNIVVTRERVGDYEGDAIVCSQSTAAIIAIRERKLRKGWFIKVPNLQADTVRPALIKVFRDIPAPLRFTCTLDNGGEFSDFRTIETLFGMDVFFCDPYSAWQKGAVENLNKAFRVFVPKGTNLKDISELEIARIENIINARPMDCLHKLSPDQAWAKELTSVGAFLH